jgi:hypothetical protein
MPVLTHSRVTGMSPDQYHTVVAVIQQELAGETPDGGIFHIAGLIENEFQIIEIWESPEHHQAFLDAYVTPAQQRLGLTVIRNISYHEIHSAVNL